MNNSTIDGKKSNEMGLVKLSAVGFLVQLLTVFATILIVLLLGPPPADGKEALLMMENPIVGLLRDDFPSIVMISLYLISFPGLVLVLRRHSSSLTILAAILSFSGVILALSSHSGLSLFHLSKEYHMTTDPAEKIQLLAASSAVFSQNIWNGSAGYFGGFFLQIGGILISLSMRSHICFSRLTVFFGISANGLDLIQHVLHPFTPAISEVIMFVMGPLYVLWFICLIKNLLGFIKNQKGENNGFHS